MKSKQEILEIFGQVISGPMNRYVSEWKKSGKKVVGYYCSYIPEELFTSIGVLPYRIRGAGSKDSSVADAYLSARLCTFVRHSLALALSGELNFLDGVVSMNSCDHIRRGFDLWKHKVKPGFSYFISVPRVQDDRVLFWFEEEMEGLKKAVEDHFGKKVTPEGLKSAITLHNRARILLKEVLDLRKSDSPPLSGTEALTAAVASQLIPEPDLIPLLEDFLAGLKKSGGGKPARARLVVAGGELDEPQFIRNIEEQGGLVVADDACFAVRSFWDLVPENGDPWKSILRRYLFHVPCARMVGALDDRTAFLTSLVKDFRADGIIFQRMKFCDIWAGESHNILWRMKKAGIPILVLDREYQVPASGQVQTRVQAFLESMGK
ncbi:MAG: 2-hydroxyacyl-CoA dehydratase family protein [bacterium]|nr:2-hydroxyacyl-CoA dehydratase family protein [bacterium]